LQNLNISEVRSAKVYIPGSDPSLKDGLGFIPASKKPLAGTKPSGEDLMHIVPPVIIINTRDSGYWAAILDRVEVNE